MMTVHSINPTPYPEVNQTLDRLLRDVRIALGEKFAGLYLYGSLSSGDFSQETSDIDFLVVTRGVLDEFEIDHLKTLHDRLGKSGMKWAVKLEGSYLPLEALPRYNPEDTRAWPTLNEGRFYLAPHGWDWVIQRYILQEMGAAVAGPPLHDLIQPVEPEDLRRAVRELLKEWWAPLLEAYDAGQDQDAAMRLDSPEYQAYAVLTMCRALHTLQTRQLVSKPAAARWAKETVGEQWEGLIDRALAWRRGDQFDELPAVLALIRYTLQAALQRTG